MDNDNLESRASVPFKLGTYNFDIVWGWLNVGKASLSFKQLTAEKLPSEARAVYDSGDLYKVIFDGRLTAPIIKKITEYGIFTSYVQIKDSDAHSLFHIAETKILGKTSRVVSTYDRKNGIIDVNGKKVCVGCEKMRFIRDPASHVIHLLFNPRNSAGRYFCGYFHAKSTELKELFLDFVCEGKKLVGRVVVPANAYFVNIDLPLRLPYNYDAKKLLFVPSLEANVSIEYSLLGSVRLDFNRFEREYK